MTLAIADTKSQFDGVCDNASWVYQSTHATVKTLTLYDTVFFFIMQ